MLEIKFHSNHPFSLRQNFHPIKLKPFFLFFLLSFICVLLLVPCIPSSFVSTLNVYGGICVTISDIPYTMYNIENNNALLFSMRFTVFSSSLFLHRSHRLLYRRFLLRPQRAVHQLYFGNRELIVKWTSVSVYRYIAVRQSCRHRHRCYCRHSTVFDCHCRIHPKAKHTIYFYFIKNSFEFSLRLSPSTSPFSFLFVFRFNSILIMPRRLHTYTLYYVGDMFDRFCSVGFFGSFSAIVYWFSFLGTLTCNKTLTQSHTHTHTQTLILAVYLSLRDSYD